MLKKLLAIIILGFFVFTMFSCNNKTADNAEDEIESSNMTSLAGADMAGYNIEAKVKICADSYMLTHESYFINLMKEYYPNITIQMIRPSVYTENPADPSTPLDIVEVMKERIPAGTGPDIFVGSIYQYFPNITEACDNGLIYDTNELLFRNPMFSLENYVVPILDSYIYDEIRYAIPLQFSAASLFMKKDVADIIYGKNTKFIDSDTFFAGFNDAFSKGLFTGSKYIFDIWSDNYFVNANLSRFYSPEENRIDFINTDFINFLNNVKSIITSNQVPYDIYQTDTEFQQMIMENKLSSNYISFSYSYSGFANIFSKLIPSKEFEKSLKEINGGYDINMKFSEDYVLMPFPSDTGGMPASCWNTAVVNANTSVPDAVAAVLNILLSVEYQSLTYGYPEKPLFMMNLPVNKEAMEFDLQYIKDTYNISESLINEVRDEYDKIDSCHNYNNKDYQTVNSFIFTFLSGLGTAEEAAENIDRYFREK